MTRMSIHAVAFVAAISLAACGRPADDRPMTGGDAAQPGAAPMARTDDTGRRDFVQRATEKNLAEIELSRLAQERAQNPQVRQFAQTMVEDHTKSLNELRQIAQRENLQINEQLRDEHREQQQRLQAMKGTEFDREYMNIMVEGHGEMVSLLQDRTGDRAMGPDRTDDRTVGTVGQQPDAQDGAELNQWAAQTLPVVERHHEQAEQIRDQLENQGTGDRGQTGTRGAPSPQNR